MESRALQEIFEAIKKCDWKEAMEIVGVAMERADQIGPPNHSTPEERERQLFLKTYKAFG
ncbi:MAG: hypothetical protein M0Z81_06440 [Deltaproteobacteria bacterium]|jgi:hypothetical protein|nr:hypothetical protein [Deltaproteobacteria bacterium]